LYEGSVIIILCINEVLNFRLKVVTLLALLPGLLLLHHMIQ